MVDTNTHPRKFVVRGPDEPEQPFDGQVWVDTSGSNVEMNQYDGGSNSWSLVIARGPDTPEYPAEGSVWTDTAAKKLMQYTGGAWEGTADSGLTQQSDAETFAESDVTLGHTDTIVNGERLQIRGFSDTTETVGAGSNYNTTMSRTRDLTAVTDVTVSDATGNTSVSDVRIGGNSVGSSFGTYDTSSYSGDTAIEVDVGNSTDSTNDIGVTWSFTGGPPSGSVTVEWPQPPDVFAWDAVTYQADDAGETVEVYVEADDGTGWTEVAGPVQRGHSLQVASTSNVRLRVDLQRSQYAVPHFDAGYRRWEV